MPTDPGIDRQSSGFVAWIRHLLGGDQATSIDEDPFADQRTNVRAPVRRLFTVYGRRYWRSFIVGVLAGVGARVLDLLPPLLLAVAIDAVFLQTRPFALAGVPGGWLPADQAGQFWLSAALITTAFIGTSLLNWVRARGLNAFAQHVQHDLRTETYDRIQRLRLSFFDEKQTGELMSVLSSNVNDLNAFLKDSVDQILQLVVTVGGVGIVLFVINWQLALVTMATTPLVGLMTIAYIRAVKPRYKSVRGSLADLFSRLENNLTGILVIKTSTTEGFERDRVARASEDYRTKNWSVLQLSTLFGPAQQATSAVAFVLTFIVGGLWVFAGPPGPFTGTLSVGEFVAFLLLSQRFVGPMAQFGSILDNYQKTHASAERVFGLLDETESAETDAPNARNLTEPAGAVTFEDVAFGYGTERGVLDGIDIDVDAGETVALVGPSGSGKSTILKLLPRLYEPDDGEIRVDGAPIEQLTLRTLRDAIGYVGQDPFMFTGTVRENIAYGVADASTDEVVDAAKAANAHRFIENLPNGYDTEVGQRGGKLSGGQRQRLSIARAVLRDPAILILDEATSAVDTETELLIQRALARLTENRTTFAIAHRLSTIRDADQIIVLEDGLVVERGPHDRLLEQAGLYAHLWQVQAGALDALPDEFIERAAARAATIRDNSTTGTSSAGNPGGRTRG